MDEDLQQMSKDQLIEEVKKLRAGIREHRVVKNNHGGTATLSYTKFPL